VPSRSAEKRARLGSVEVHHRIRVAGCSRGRAGLGSRSVQIENQNCGLCAVGVCWWSGVVGLIRRDVRNYTSRLTFQNGQEQWLQAVTSVWVVTKGLPQIAHAGTMGLQVARDNHLRHFAQQVILWGRALAGRRFPQAVHRRVSTPGSPFFTGPAAGWGSTFSES
jgi:hypothetical protein